MALVFVIRDRINDCLGLDLKPKISEDLFPVREKNMRFRSPNVSKKSCTG